MADPNSNLSKPSVHSSFSMDCPNCGPSTIHFLDGEQVPHGCDYDPPAIVIDCGEATDG